MQVIPLVRTGCCRVSKEGWDVLCVGSESSTLLALFLCIKTKEAQMNTNTGTLLVC